MTASLLKPPIRQYYPEVDAGGFTRADGTVAFYSRVRALLTPDSIVVDFGCGRGQAAEDSVPFRRDIQRLKGSAARVIGIDVDPAGALNSLVDEFRILRGRWPVEDSSTDLVVCDHVVEHLPEPSWFCAEAARALRPGGYLCVRTPNRFGYVALASRLVPARYHTRLLSRAQPLRADHDVFPTLYRCNTAAALRRCFAAYGFAGAVYAHESEPTYLNFSGLAYRAGVLFERLAPGAIRNVLFAFGRKLKIDPDFNEE